MRLYEVYCFPSGELRLRARVARACIPATPTDERTTVANGALTFKTHTLASLAPFKWHW